MKALATILATAALAVAGVTTADAAVFSPAGISFNLNGTFTLKPPMPYPIANCNITLSSTTPSPAGSIAPVTAVNITGSNPLCAVIAAGSLPWSLQITSPTTVKINNMKLQVAGSPCYPSPLAVPGNWSNVTGMSVTNQVVGLCVLTMQIMPSPWVSVL
ncbi:hypothetical protein ACSC9U_13820 [Pseudomonas solani]|uniref:hypothetical protein n=1 Tax=Pseudomonas solani TaxID=2731552 RepID=UPI003F4ACCB9